MDEEALQHSIDDNYNIIKEGLKKFINGHVSFDECRLFRYDLLRAVDSQLIIWMTVDTRFVSDFIPYYSKSILDI